MRGRSGRRAAPMDKTPHTNGLERPAPSDPPRAASAGMSFSPDQPAHAHDLPHLRLAAAGARARPRRPADRRRVPRARAGRQPVQRAIPLELVRCDMTRDQDACGLIQTRHTVPGSILYQLLLVPQRRQPHDDREPARHRARASRSSPASTAGDLVVDIGCNDGTLLDGYADRRTCASSASTPPTSTRYAVEKGYDVVRDFFCASRAAPALRRPARRRSSRASRCSTTSRTRATFVARRRRRPGRGRRLGDGAALPAADARGRTPSTRSCTSTSSTTRWPCSSGCSPRRASRSSTAELNDMNGGSIRLFIAPRRPARAAPPRQRSALPGAAHPRVRDGARLAGALRGVRAATSSGSATSSQALCESLAAEGKTIHVYGASTKGNTILQYAGLDTPLIPYAADRNPDKWGSETIATGIPIISEEESRAMKPDYYLVLPWHFLDEFLEREQRVPRGRRRASSSRCPRSASSARSAPSRARSSRAARAPPGVRCCGCRTSTPFSFRPSPRSGSPAEPSPKSPISRATFGSGTARSTRPWRAYSPPRHR